MGAAQQSLIAVRNEIMQVCAQMPVDGTNVVALEQILDMCETTLASLDRTHVRLIAWKQIYPNHTIGTLTSDHLTFDDGDDYNWASINDDDDDDDDDVLNLNNDALALDDDDDDDDDDDSLDLNDDDFYRVADDDPNDGPNDEYDAPPSERYSAYLLPSERYSAYLPPSFAPNNMQGSDNFLTDHEFALLFGLVQPTQDSVTLMPPTVYDIFGDPLPVPVDSSTPPYTDAPMMYDIFGNVLPVPPNSPLPSHIDAPRANDTYPDPDPDYNVPGSL
jgi:hypothetical protein